MLPITKAPYPFFFDLDGLPLDEGSVYYGVANANPVTTQVPVFWDAAGTLPAAQPIRTLNGFTVHFGTPANVYTEDPYSISVYDKKGRLVFTHPDSSQYDQLPAFIADLANNTDTSKGAALVGYKYPAASAVGRTVFSRLTDQVSVRDFGATGNGVTDDTAAIQAAINESLSIYFPAGTYICSGVTIPTKRSLIGESMGGVVIKTPNATGDVFTVTDIEVTIERMSFDSAVARTAGSYIAMTSSSGQVTVRDFFMRGAFIGITTATSYALRVLFGTMLEPSALSGSAMIVIDGGNDHNFDQLYLSGDQVGTMPDFGFLVKNTGAANITNCEVIRCGTDLMISPGTGQNVASFWALNTFFDTANAGIVIRPSGSGQVVRSRFTSCWTASHTGNGITIQADGASNIDGVEFIGHQALFNGNVGSIVQSSTGTTNNIRFIGGVFCSNTFQGLFFSNGIGEFSVSHARIGSGFGLITGNTVGIEVQAGTSSQYTFIGNDCRGNSIAGIIDNGAGPRIIIGNLGYVTRNSGGATIVIGSSSTVINHGLDRVPTIANITVTAGSDPAASSVPQFYVTNITGTTFQIATTALVAGADFLVGWQANVAGS